MKIKTVEIESFRGYKDKQIFNFVKNNDNKVADLVVIYGPNGFGKTSFTDSIEWLFTGQVKRINSSKGVVAAFENEKNSSPELFLLKNNKNESKYGFVKLINESDNYIKAETKPLNGRTKRDYDMKSDNRCKFNKTGKFENVKKIDFLSSNLITSDNINSFLQFDDPQERFLILKDIWDSDNNSEMYQNILGLASEFNSNHEEIKREIIYKEKLIKTSENNESNNDIIKKLLEKTKILNKDIELTLLESKDNYSLNIEKLLELNINKEKQIKETEINIKIFDELIKNYEKYKNDLKIIGQIEQEKKIYSLKESLEKNEKLIKELEYIYKNKELYSGLKKEKEEKNRIINETIKKQNKILENSIDYDKKIKELSTNMNILENNIEEIIKIERKGHVVLSNKKIIIDNDFFIEKKELLIKDFSNRIKIKENYIDKIITLKNAFEKKYKISDELKDIKNMSLKMRAKKINNCVDLLNEVVKEEMNLKVVKEDFLEQQEKMEKLFSICFDILDEKEISNCPVCNTNFKTQNELLKTIKNNSNDFNLQFDKQEKLEKNIKKLKNQILKEREKIGMELDFIYQNSNKKLLKYSEALRTVLKEKELLIEKNEELEKIESSFKVSMKKISNTLGENITTLDDLNQKKLGIIKEKEKLQEIITVLNNSIKTLNLDINELKNIIYINESDIKLINLNEDYNMIINLLEKNKLNLKEKEWVLFLEEKKSRSEEKVKDINKELLKYNDVNLIWSISELNINEVEKIEHQKTEDIKKYFQKYKEIGLKKELIDENKLIKLKIESNNRLIKFKDENKTIEELLKGIKILKDVETLEDELIKLKEKEEKIIIKNQIFENFKAECEELLNEKINTAFNLDIINNIYQMIDPHPDLKEISFKADFEGKKPKLHIMASKGEEKLSPVLYFSSAQVSVLALSIFFAKALQSSNGLDTIFLDDPIQHLDSINTLAFIDFIRNIMTSGEINKQIVLTTNNQIFFNMLKRKVDDKYYNSKFIELESYGKIKAED